MMQTAKQVKNNFDETKIDTFKEILYNGKPRQIQKFYKEDLSGMWVVMWKDDDRAGITYVNYVRKFK